MNFQNAVKSGFKNAFNFSGRASRSEYWYFLLMGIGLNIIATLIDKAIFHTPPVTMGPARITLSIVFFIPCLSLFVRRMHDTDRRGWWFFLHFLLVIGSIILLVWKCLKGTSGPNRFGADPLANEPINS